MTALVSVNKISVGRSRSKTLVDDRVELTIIGTRRIPELLVHHKAILSAKPTAESSWDADPE